MLKLSQLQHTRSAHGAAGSNSGPRCVPGRTTTPRSGPSRTEVARREVVREQLAAIEVRHPRPLRRLQRSLSFDSVTSAASARQQQQSGLLHADTVNIPAIAFVEARGPQRQPYHCRGRRR